MAENPPSLTIKDEHYNFNRAAFIGSDSVVATIVTETACGSQR